MEPDARTLVVLGWIAGAVDAVAFQVLGHLFVSNMTGNVDAFGIELVDGELARAIERGYPLIPFSVGVFLGTLLAGASREGHRAIRAARLRLLGAELLLVIATAAVILAFVRDSVPLSGGSWRFYVVATTAAVSMGVQNVAFVATSDNGPNTTHITGALTTLAHGLARRAAGRGKVNATRQAGLVLGFIAGAVTAAMIFQASVVGASVVTVPALVALIWRTARRDTDRD